MISHAIRIWLFSLFATITLLPISAVDTYYVSTFNKYFYVITVGFIVVSDLMTAFITHLFGRTLVNLIVRSEKNKRKLAEVGERVSQKGKWGITLFAATPLPYSLAIYFYAGAKVPFKTLAIPLLIGRLIKYTIITIALIVGWNIFI